MKKSKILLCMLLVFTLSACSVSKTQSVSDASDAKIKKASDTKSVSNENNANTEKASVLSDDQTSLSDNVSQSEIPFQLDENILEDLPTGALSVYEAQELLNSQISTYEGSQMLQWPNLSYIYKGMVYQEIEGNGSYYIELHSKPNAGKSQIMSSYLVGMYGTILSLDQDSGEWCQIRSGNGGSEEEVVVKPEKMILSSKQQKEINIFLSNFTEVYFDEFIGVPSNKELIDFGVWHNYINNFKLIKIKENEPCNGYLDKSHVERSVKKYFDLSVKHEKTEWYDFDGNNYIIGLADGEGAIIAVVSKMYDNKDGTYTAYFYEVWSDSLDYGVTPKEMKEEMKKHPDEIDIRGQKKAIVARHDFEGKKIYKLLEYSIVK